MKYERATKRALTDFSNTSNPTRPRGSRMPSNTSNLSNLANLVSAPPPQQLGSTSALTNPQPLKKFFGSPNQPLSSFHFHERKTQHPKPINCNMPLANFLA